MHFHDYTIEYLSVSLTDVFNENVPGKFYLHVGVRHARVRLSRISKSSVSASVYVIERFREALIVSCV